jgi:hypothetical protein
MVAVQKLHTHRPQPRSRGKCSWRASQLPSGRASASPADHALFGAIRFAAAAALLFAVWPPSCLWPWHWQRNARTLSSFCGSAQLLLARRCTTEEWWWIFNWRRGRLFGRSFPLLLRVDLSPRSVTLRVKNVRGWRVRREDGHAETRRILSLLFKLSALGVSTSLAPFQLQHEHLFSGESSNTFSFRISSICNH